MTMKANIDGRGDLRKVNPAWFTGRTWMKVVSDKIGSKEQDIYHVHFERGSRTKLHKHDGSQVLIATKGRGSLELFEKVGSGRPGFAVRKTSRTQLAKGDVVYVPAGTLHAHGSVGRAEFAHIAINILPRRGSAYGTTWYETGPNGRATAIT